MFPSSAQRPVSVTDFIQQPLLIIGTISCLLQQILDAPELITGPIIPIKNPIMKLRPNIGDGTRVISEGLQSGCLPLHPLHPFAKCSSRGLEAGYPAVQGRACISGKFAS